MIRIALDVDDVLADTHTEIIKEINKIYNKNFTSESLNDWKIEKSLNIPTKEFLDIYKKVWKNAWGNIKPLVSNEDLKPLIEKYDVDLVTSRDGETVGPLNLWINKHFPSLKNTRIITTESIEKKAELDYNYYIDDAPVLAEEIEKRKTSRLILVTRPWNKNVKESEFIKRVKDLKEAIIILTNQ